MGLDTSSAPAETIAPKALSALLSDTEDSVLVLVLQSDTFAKAALRGGRRRAVSLERRTLQRLHELRDALLGSGDVIVHAARSECFAIAFIEGTRTGMDIRRIAAIEHEVSRSVVIDCVIGWVWIDRTDEVEKRLSAVIEAARLRVQRRELAVLLHDVATPISAIHSSLSAALDGILEAPTERRFLLTARDEAARAGRLIRSFLAAASVESALCDIASALVRAQKAVEPIAYTRGVTIRVQTGDAPAVASLASDEAVAALAAILENAVKHGAAHGNVWAGIRIRDRTCELTIDDDGPGIADDQHEQIFEFGVSRSGSGGTGIGLAGTRKIIERCGGSVTAARSPLGGARFVLKIPIFSETRRDIDGDLAEPPALPH